MTPESFIQYAIPRNGGDPYIWDWADDAETLRPQLRYLAVFDHSLKGGFIRYPDGRIELPDGSISIPDTHQTKPCQNTN